MMHLKQLYSSSCHHCLALRLVKLVSAETIMQWPPDGGEAGFRAVRAVDMCALLTSLGHAGEIDIFDISCNRSTMPARWPLRLPLGAQGEGATIGKRVSSTNDWPRQ